MANASILFVRGGKDVMSHVFSKHGFGYWSAAFDTLLEKHGVLDFDVASQSILDDGEALGHYEMVVVAWLPPESWNKSYVETLSLFDGTLFLEGPYPDFVKDFLGLEAIESLRVKKDRLVIRDAGLSQFVTNHFSVTLSGRTDSIELSPKVVQTRAKKIARQELETGEDLKFEKRLRNITLSYLLAYKNRFDRWGSFFPKRPSLSKAVRLMRKIRTKNPYANDTLDALALLAWCRFLNKLKPGEFRKSYLGFLWKVCNDFPPIEIKQGDEEELIALTVRGIAFAEASYIQDNNTLLERSVVIARRVSAAIDNLKPKLLLRLWHVLLLARLSGQNLQIDRFLEEACNTATRLFPKPETPVSPPLLWLGITITNVVRDKNLVLADNLFAAVQGHLEKLQELSQNGLPRALEGKNLWEAILIAGASAAAGNFSISRGLFGAIVDQAYDKEKSLFRSAKISKGKFRVDKGFQIIPWVTLGLLEGISDFEIWDPSKAMSSYEPEQVAAWEKTPFWIEPYTLQDAAAFAIMTLESSKCIGLFRKGKVMGSSFQILSHLVHYHTMHPLKEAFYDCPARHVLVLEHILFYLLESLQRASGRPFLKIHPWPWGKDYCLTIRHDVDRPISKEVFERLLEFEQRNNLGVSWYWIPGRVNQEQIVQLELAGHEIGLHSMRLTNKSAEVKEVQRALRLQSRIWGEQWHGGGGGDYWIGHPSIRSAVQMDLLYTEFVSTINDLPYACFPLLKKDGTIDAEKIVGTTRFISVDSAARLSHEDKMVRFGWLRELAACKFYCILLNHPDANFEELKEWVEDLPADTRLNWNCSQVARWWKDTHTRDGLEVKRTGKFSFRLTARHNVSDLELHLLCTAEEVEDVIITAIGVSHKAEWEKGQSHTGDVVRIRLDLQASTPAEISLRLAKPDS